MSTVRRWCSLGCQLAKQALFITAMASPALTLSACAADNGPVAQAQTVQQRAANAPEAHDTYAKLGYRFTWRGFPVMAANARVTHFDVFDDIVIVQENANTLTVIEATTGANRWSAALGRPTNKFVGNVRTGDRVLSSSDHELFILNVDTGALLDRQGLEVVVNTSPVVFGSTVVYGATSGEVIGHNMGSRYKRWGYLLKGAIRSDPATAGALVGVVSQGGDAIIIDPATGSSTSRGRIFDGLANDPVANASAMYVAGLDQSIWAFSTFGGERLWRLRTQYPIKSQPTVHDGVLYVNLQEKGLTAINTATGEIIWETKDAPGEVMGQRDGLLFVWDGARATLVDKERGGVMEQTELPGVHELRMSSFEDGDLYTVTRSGVVSKFMPKG